MKLSSVIKCKYVSNLKDVIFRHELNKPKITL